MVLSRRRADALNAISLRKFPPDALPANSEFWINYDFFDEARAFANGMITMFFVNVDAASKAARRCAARTVGRLGHGA